MARVRWGYTAIVLGCLLLAGPAYGDWQSDIEGQNAPAQPQIITPDQIDTAIEKCKQELYLAQHDGNWEESDVRQSEGSALSKTATQWGGLTSLATFALLAAGESAQDPRIVKALDYLKDADIIGTYALGMRLCAYEQLPDNKKYRPVILRDSQLLMSYMKTQDDAKGLFGYPMSLTSHTMEAGGYYDHSNSQFAVLGLWSADRSGMEIPTGNWDVMDAAWKGHQRPDGSWGYMAGASWPGTASMTAAGVASLYLTQDMLHGHEGVDCTGSGADNANIQAGLKWLTDNFGKVNNNYTWFGISRIGVASGLKYFGTTDWFKEGAAVLAAPDGGYPKGGEVGYMPAGFVGDTAFALLFLARGGAPVIMNKLQYGGAAAAAPWNQRPRDAANFTRWAGRQSESFLNWQIVNLDASMADLHEAPILYIAGNHGLTFDPAQEAKLKQFVEEGGLIVGNADCASSSFSTAFRALGKRLFPAYAFRRLPKEHVIFHNIFDRSHWSGNSTVEGLSNGARELMILFPDEDPARYWQVMAYSGRESAHELMFNIYMYAVDKKIPRHKGETYLVKANGGAGVRSIKVARLQYAGNWDPEPGGWRRLAAVMRNVEKTDLQVDPVVLGQGGLAGYSIAHLTGTDGTFTLDAHQQGELRQFVAGGGTLIVDACGGSADFAEAAQKQLSAIWGLAADQLKQVLPANHPAYAAASVRCDHVGYRAYMIKMLGRLRTPRVRGIEIGNRVAVFFSPEDLSVGLVGQQVDGIVGYQPQLVPGGKDEKGVALPDAAGASQVMASLLLYAGPK